MRPVRACPTAGIQMREDIKVPKQKTKSSAKKRFRLTATGKVRFNHAYRRHRLISKSKAAKERSQGTGIMADGDARLVIRYMLPNG